MYDLTEKIQFEKHLYRCLFLKQPLTTYRRQTAMNIFYQSNYQSEYQIHGQNIYLASTTKRNHRLLYVCRCFSLFCL
jgi:hypothetical protein